MRVTYTTETGSVYQVNEATKEIRRLEGGTGTKRITGEWRPYLDAWVEYGRLLVNWGFGRDAVSDELGTVGDSPMRLTTTSKIIETTFTEELSDLPRG